MEKNIFEVIVVGNGALGCALSIELGLIHNIQVALIGKDSRPFSGSLAAGAMTNCYGEMTDETFIFPHQERFKISEQALLSWEPWIRFISAHSDKKIIHGKGTYLILNSFGGSADNRNFNIIENYVTKNNIKHSSIDVTDLPLNPVDQHKPLKSLYLFDEGYVNPNSLFDAYDDIITHNNNITNINCEIINIQEEKNRFKVTFVNNEIIYGQKLVFAAGFFNNECMLKLSGIEEDIIPQFGSVGSALHIQAENHGIKNVIRTPSRGGGCGFNLVPRDENHLYFGGTASLSLSEVQFPSIYYISNLIRALSYQFDRKLLFSKITNFIVGHRPFTLDKLPVIGCLNNPNIWVLSGFNRDGFHCAPIIAKTVAEELLSNMVSQYQMFSPLRKPFFIRSIEESINHFCNHHYLSAISEMEPKLQFAHDDYIIDGVRRDIASVYNDLNISFGLDPEILWMLLRLYKNKDSNFNNFKNLIKKYELAKVI